MQNPEREFAEMAVELFEQDPDGWTATGRGKGWAYDEAYERDGMRFRIDINDRIRLKASGEDIGLSFWQHRRAKRIFRDFQRGATKRQTEARREKLQAIAQRIVDTASAGERP